MFITDVFIISFHIRKNILLLYKSKSVIIFSSEATPLILISVRKSVRFRGKRDLLGP